MSLLFPLYFFAASAIGLPILFHLIRQRPRAKTQFSSLMFLDETPPRLTRKSRLNNWLLLLIRMLALIAIVAAFSRPFLRDLMTTAADPSGRRIVLMLDTSASMRRGDLMTKARDQAREVVADLRRGDSVALVTFDSRPQTIVSFEESAELDLPQLQSTLRAAIAERTPSWAETDLGTALSFAAELATSFNPEQETATDDGNAGDNTTYDNTTGAAPETDTTDANTDTGPASLVLISDLQRGSKTESLNSFPWPKKLFLDVRRVQPPSRSNGTIRMLAGELETTSGAKSDETRIRISNAGDSPVSAYQIGWADVSGVIDVASGRTVQVAAGDSTVVTLASPPESAVSIVLSGDDFDFDNTSYFTQPSPNQLNIGYIGKPKNTIRENLLHYLQLIPLDDRTRTVTTAAISREELRVANFVADVTPLIVVAQELSSDEADVLRRYAAAGGHVLFVIESGLDRVPIEAMIRSVSQDDGLTLSEASVRDYAMMSRVNFDDPLFAPLVGPEFNDFTKIRFWSHRSLGNLDSSWTVCASFDDGDPAIVYRATGDGRISVLTSGWQPSDSQLALSTKYLPLIHGLFATTTDARRIAADYTVGDSVTMIDPDAGPLTRVAGPAPERSATQIDRSAGTNQSTADRLILRQPGIFRVGDEPGGQLISVNLSPSESLTEPIDAAELEQFGIILGETLTTEQQVRRDRNLREREIESQQRLWQWLLLIGLGLLGLETLIGLALGIRIRNSASAGHPASADQPTVGPLQSNAT